MAMHSQLGDILGDTPGQDLEVLVAAAHHSVEAGALLRALGPWDATRLLLTCTGHRRHNVTGSQLVVPQALRDAGFSALHL